MARIDTRELFKRNLQRHPHFRRYLDDWAGKGRPPPEFYENLQSRMKTMEEFNFIYPLQEPNFIHAYRLWSPVKNYMVVEPTMDQSTCLKYRLIEVAFSEEGPDLSLSTSEYENERQVDKFIRQMTTDIMEPPPGWLARKLGLAPHPKIYASDEDRKAISIHLLREKTGRSALTPMIGDPYLDGLVSAGGGRLEVLHKVWGTMEASMRFKDASELDAMLEKEAARSGPTVPPEHPLSFRTSRGATGIIHR